MPAARQTMGVIVRFGVKYGPLAVATLRRAGVGSRGAGTAGHNGATGRRAADHAAADHRATALEHADHLLDGSVLPVFDGDARVWVVFSGDLPVASHPTVRTPLVDLLQYYDLTKRIRPDSNPLPAEPIPTDQNRRPGRWIGPRYR